VKPTRADGKTVEISKNKIILSSQTVNELDRNDSACKTSGTGMDLTVVSKSDGRAKKMRVKEDNIDVPNMTQCRASMPSK